MIALRTRFRSLSSDESGLTLVEVVVAMMIFALISTGAIYSMISVLAVTRDTRSAQVAANLAAQEIDFSRDVADIFALTDETRSVQLNGDTFTVVRSSEWVSEPGLDLECGTGTGGIPLRYKRVNVSVTWANMRSSAEPVHSDTIIDPKNRINDPSLGTILVSVLNAGGTGSSGIAVSAVPYTAEPNGAANLATAPKPTDAQGCTYILKVKPGNYKVSVSKSGYIDANQETTGSRVVGVSAGAAASVGFQYDIPAKFTAKFAGDYSATPVRIPLNLDASFLSTYGTYVSSVTNNSALSRQVSLHPFAAGYQVIAGKYVPKTTTSDGCLSPDPSQWTRIRDRGDWFYGERPDANAAVPGGTAANSIVPMGIVTLNLSGNPYLRAVSTDPLTPDDGPGCEITMDYYFGQLTSPTTTIALPYGSWMIYTGSTAASQNASVGAGSMSLVTKGSVSLGVVLNLDPRTIEE
ncbi:MAG: hypothetical protein RI885_467 [Actinomycetota bacterium]